MAELKFVGYSEYYLLFVVFSMKWKKNAQRDANTAHWTTGCSKAEPKIFARHRPNKQTHPHTHTNRQDQLQYTVPQLTSTQCKEEKRKTKEYMETK